MKVSSKKNKARRLQNLIRDSFLELYPELTLNDIRSTPMGVPGIDIQLSEKARELIPYAVEAKYQEKMNILKEFEQAKTNAKKEELIPVLIVKKNRVTPKVLLEFSDFLNIIKEINK